MPTTPGKFVRITESVGATRYFDLLTEQDSSSIMIYLDKPPFDWYYKIKSTVAYATTSTEYVVAKTATEKVYNLRHTHHITTEAIATGTIRMFHVAGIINNPADCMTKFLGHQVKYCVLRPVHFWQGETAQLPIKGE